MNDASNLQFTNKALNNIKEDYKSTSGHSDFKDTHNNNYKSTLDLSRKTKRIEYNLNKGTGNNILFGIDTCQTSTFLNTQSCKTENNGCDLVEWDALDKEENQEEGRLESTIQDSKNINRKRSTRISKVSSTRFDDGRARYFPPPERKYILENQDLCQPRGFVNSRIYSSNNANEPKFLEATLNKVKIPTFTSNFLPNCTFSQKPPKSAVCKPHACDTCRKGFSKRGDLKKHVLIHTGEKPYSCPQCGKEFRQNAGLQIHLQIHTGVKPFACHECGKRFRQNAALQNHLLIHTGEKPYGCPVCGKNFRHTVNLQSHLLVHTGEKPYGCDTCKKCFGQRGQLKKHLLVHTGEKPYGCETCGKKFRQRVQLRKHLLIHTGEKPHGCDICGHRFRQGDQLKRHMVVHTRKARIPLMIVETVLDVT